VRLLLQRLPIASVARLIWSADIELLSVAASTSWLLCTRYYIVITLPDSAFELISLIIMTTKTIGAQGL